MKRTTLMITGAAVMTLCMTAAMAADMTYKFALGESYTYAWKQVQNVKMKGMPGMGDGEFALTMKVDAAMRYKVDAVDKSTAALTIGFDSFKLSTDQPGAAPEQVNQMMKSVSFVKKLDLSGNATSFEVKGVDSTMSQHDIVVMAKSFVERVHPNLGGKKLKKGVSWSSKAQSAMPLAGLGMNATVNSTESFKVTKIGVWEGKKAVFLDTQVAIDITSPSMGGTGKPVMQGKGLLKGTVVFLTTEGRVGELTMKGTQTNILAMPMGAPGAGPDVPEQTQIIDMETSLKLNK